MHFYWVRNHIQQVHLIVFWQSGKTNLADYLTKHHPPAHQKTIRIKYLCNMHTKALHLFFLRGCVDAPKYISASE